MPFFDLIIRWVESSDFGPKSDDLGHRILKSDFIPSDFCIVGLQKKTDSFFQIEGILRRYFSVFQSIEYGYTEGTGSVSLYQDNRVRSTFVPLYAPLAVPGTE